MLWDEKHPLTADVFLPDVCQLRMTDVRLNRTFSEREFFSLNCRKSAVEYNRNGKVSQNVQNFKSFLKNWLNFFEKNLNFFQNR